MFEFIINNLDFSYSQKFEKVLKNVNLNIHPNKFTAIIGANGSGKSTLFKLLSGEEQPSSGSVKYYDKEILDIDLKSRSKDIAIVHQITETINYFTVEEVVEMGRTPYQSFFNNKLTKYDKEAVQKAIKMVGLENKKNKYFNQLSGGQRQRVWIALALAKEPKTILLDEPMTFLDIKYQLEILSLLKKLIKEYNITVVAILHDLNQVLHYSDYLIALKDGLLYAEGETKDTITKELVRDLFDVNSDFIKCLHGKKILDIYLEE